MYNVLFLDCDGVIKIGYYFSDTCIDNINTLCREYNLKIVIISTYRKRPDYIEMFRDAGIADDIEIIGRTGDQELTREDEIKKYISEHPNINKFIIIDDGRFIDLEKYQVKTYFDYGFDDEKLKEARSLLNKD